VKSNLSVVGGFLKNNSNLLVRFINWRVKLKRLCTPFKVIGMIKSQLLIKMGQVLRFGKKIPIHQMLMLCMECPTLVYS